MAHRYPKPGTMAARILDHIRDNPGVSTNGIIRKLDLNPSPARTCIKALQKHRLISDELNDEGHHSYTATKVGTRV